MRLIRFRREGSSHWEIALDEDHLQRKLNGEMAEVIMPAKPWYVRLYRYFFPVKCIECQANGKPVELNS